MAEEIQQSPLAAASQAVNPVTNPMAALQSMALTRAQNSDTYMQQQQAAYAQEMNRLREMIQQPSAADESSMWGSLAEGASSVAPLQGNLGQMLGKMGASYGKQQDLAQQQKISNENHLAALMSSELRALESKDQMTQHLRALGGNKGANPTIKVVDGKLVKYDPATGQTEVLAGSQDQMKSKLLQTFYSKRVANEDPDALANAQKDVEAALQGFGGTTVTGATNAIPGVRSTSEPNNFKVELPIDVNKLPPETQAQIDKLMLRLETNPSPELRAATMTQLQKLLPQQTPKEVTPLKILDKAKQKMEIGTAEETGKALGKEHEALNAGAAASGKMISQLDLLNKLYENPNMPEGELAGTIQQLRSGLKSLGVDVGTEVGAADMAKAIASNFALHMRTGEGQNLLPGAMSNYEDQLLQKMAPTLSLTNEGRLALAQYMKEMAKSNMRFAEEANKLAEGNRGILPSEWRTRRERIQREEMARLSLANREIMKRFAQPGAQ